MARDPTASTTLHQGHPTPSGGEREDHPAWTVLYDSDCGFCRWSLGVLLALDRQRRLRPVPLGSAEADALLEDMPEAEREASWHLVAPDGGRQSAGAAAPPLLRLLPGGRVPAAALSKAPRLTERAYRLVADNRSLLIKAIPRRAKERADTRIERGSERRP